MSRCQHAREFISLFSAGEFSYSLSPLSHSLIPPNIILSLYPITSHLVNPVLSIPSVEEIITRVATKHSANEQASIQTALSIQSIDLLISYLSIYRSHLFSLSITPSQSTTQDTIITLQSTSKQSSRPSTPKITSKELPKQPSKGSSKISTPKLSSKQSTPKLTSRELLGGTSKESSPKQPQLLSKELPTATQKESSLEDLIENFSPSIDTLSVVDSALAILYASHQTSSLVPFIQSPNQINLSSVKSHLVSTNKHYALSLIHKNNNNLTQTLDIWTNIINGSIIDADFPGIHSYISLLSTIDKHEIIFKYAPLALSLDPINSVSIFTNASIPPSSAIEFIQNYSTKATSAYLSHIISSQNNQDPELHTRLANIYLDDIIFLSCSDDSLCTSDTLLESYKKQILSSFTTSSRPSSFTHYLKSHPSPLSSSREKFIRFVASSNHTNFNSILSRWNSDPRLSNFLYPERIAILKRLNQHHRVVHDIAIHTCDIIDLESYIHSLSHISIDTFSADPPADLSVDCPADLHSRPSDATNSDPIISSISYPSQSLPPSTTVLYTYLISIYIQSTNQTTPSHTTSRIHFNHFAQIISNYPYIIHPITIIKSIPKSIPISSPILSIILTTITNTLTSLTRVSRITSSISHVQTQSLKHRLLDTQSRTRVVMNSDPKSRLCWVCTKPVTDVTQFVCNVESGTVCHVKCNEDTKSS